MNQQQREALAFYADPKSYVSGHNGPDVLREGWTRAQEALKRIDESVGYNIDAHSFLCGCFARQDSKGLWHFTPQSGKSEEKACEALDAFEEWWRPAANGVKEPQR